MADIGQYSVGKTVNQGIDDQANNLFEVLSKSIDEKKARDADRAIKEEQLQEQIRHNQELEKVQGQQTSNTGQYHNALVQDLSERRLIDKYKALGIGANGKPLGNEAQKSHNLLTSAENSLQDTKKLVDENPMAAIGEKVLPNGILSLLGGNMKRIMDSKSVTKEALQNYATGAAASGEQVPAFQSWSGPGIGDIVRGDTGPTPEMSRTISTLKQGYSSPEHKVSQEQLDFLKLGNDPAARALVQQGSTRDAAMAAPQGPSPEDAAALQFIQDPRNQAHPKAAAVAAKLKAKGLIK